jgi:dTDP-4-amino-4,6-dideoxygalactose transaminase
LEGVLAKRRLDIVNRLKAAGIGTSIYYPQPVPRMRYYRDKYGYDAGRFPNAEAISDASVALPVGPHITLDDEAFIAEQVCRIFKEVGS